MKRRYMALFLVALLLPCCIAVPADAAYTNSCWINLMDFYTGGSLHATSFDFPLPYGTTLYNVDFLIQTPATSLTPSILIQGYGSSTLNSLLIGGDSTRGFIYRVYGTLPLRYYELLHLDTGISNTWCTLLSAECSTTQTDSFDAPASGYVTYLGGKASQNISISSDASDFNFATPIVENNQVKDYRVFLDCTDWQKYDYYTMLIECYCSTITSVAVYQGSEAVPFTISYLDNSTWSDDGFLFTVRIDLRDVNRESPDVPQISFFGNLFEVTFGVNGFAINRCQGEIEIDTVEPQVSWLQKIKNSIDGFWHDVGAWFAGIGDTIATWGQNIVDAITGGDKDTSASDTLKEQGQQMQQYEQQHQAVLENSLTTFQSGSNLVGFATALAFVGNYTTDVYGSLGEYQIIFTLPLTIGLVLFLASRVRGYDKPQKNNKTTKEVKAKPSKAVKNVTVKGVK